MLNKKFRAPAQKFPRGGRVVFRGDGVVVKETPNELRHNRVGVIIGRSFAKSSHSRNVAKRVIMDLFRDYPLSGVRVGDNKDILIVITGSGTRDTNDLSATIKELSRVVKEL